jgi:hypothetical protein
MALCFSAMRQQVGRLLKQTDTILNSAIGNFINQEIRALNSQHFMESLTGISCLETVAGTPLVEMNANCKNIIQIWDVSSKWTQKDFADMVTQFPGLNAAGSYAIPTYYAPRELTSDNKQQIYIYPTPNVVASFSVQSYIKQTELVGDGDYMTIPPEFEQIQDLVMVGAARLGALSQKDATTYAIFEKEYERIKLELVKANERQADKDSAWGFDHNFGIGEK